MAVITISLEGKAETRILNSTDKGVLSVEDRSGDKVTPGKLSPGKPEHCAILVAMLRLGFWEIHQAKTIKEFRA